MSSTISMAALDSSMHRFEISTRALISSMDWIKRKL